MFGDQRRATLLFDIKRPGFCLGRFRADQHISEVAPHKSTSSSF
jgi:hypothetical protein